MLERAERLACPHQNITKATFARLAIICLYCCHWSSVLGSNRHQTLYAGPMQPTAVCNCTLWLTRTQACLACCCGSSGRWACLWSAMSSTPRVLLVKAGLQQSHWSKVSVQHASAVTCLEACLCICLQNMSCCLWKVNDNKGMVCHGCSDSLLCRSA